jgi:hypothetical protein
MRSFLRAPLLILVAAVVSISACEPAEDEDTDEPTPTPTPTATPNVVPAGNRVIALEINQPASEDHGEMLGRAKDIGASAVQLTFSWQGLEPTANQIDVSFLEFGMGYYRDQGVEVVLSIPTLDTVAKLVPPDLAGTPMDDAQMIARFATLLDEVLAVCGDELAYLVIGNEVNINLDGAPPADWDAFKAFVDAGVAHVHSVKPGVPVGISLADGELPDARVNTLVSGTDVFFGTYYRIGNDFGGGAADPNTPAEAFDLFLDAAGPTQPVVVKECGYPTGTQAGGSPAGQEQFVADVFTAWDERAARMPLLTYSRMFDGLRSECESTAASYGLPGNEPFIDFLCTLGLRNYDDTPKPAWDDFSAHMTARGF